MNKTIEFTVRQGNSEIKFRDVFSDVSTWMAQAYLFHKFLIAQGFQVDSEQVSADVEAYVSATEVLEEW